MATQQTSQPDRHSVAFWVAWAAGIVAAIVAILAYVNDLQGNADGGPSDGSTVAACPSTPTPTPTPETENSTAPSTESSSPTPVSGIVAINVEIPEAQRRGPGRAFACDFVPSGGCTNLQVFVMTDGGRLVDNCYLKWKVYRLVNKNATLLETGSTPHCQEIEVGRDRELPPGTYRVDMTATTDDRAVKGSGSYMYITVLDG